MENFRIRDSGWKKLEYGINTRICNTEHNYYYSRKNILKMCCFLLTKNGVDAVVLALDNELCHDDHVLGVHRPLVIQYFCASVFGVFTMNSVTTNKIFKILTFSASVLSTKGNLYIKLLSSILQWNQQLLLSYTAQEGT
jgi:hypothetical protein